MDMSKTPLFRIMTERMAYLGQREKILAQNIANADTPNYVSKDLRPVNFADQMQREQRRVSPTMTSAGHLPPASKPERFIGEKDRKPYEVLPSKNGVVLEEQMMKVAETQVDYQTTTALYRKYMDMMKIALRG